MIKNRIYILIILFIAIILDGCISFRKKNEVLKIEDYKQFTYIVDTIVYPNSSLVLFDEKNFTMPIITNDSNLFMLKQKKNDAQYFIENELGYYYLGAENFSAFLSWISINASEMVKYFNIIDKYDLSSPRDTIKFNKKEGRIIYDLNYEISNKKFLVLMLKMDPKNFENPLFHPPKNIGNPYYVRILCPIK
jgi:hypothetical protein